MNDMPFVHLMKSPYCYYVFDVNTNSIVRVSKELYEYLLNEQQGRNPLSTVEIEREKTSLMEKGYLKTKHPKEIDNPNIDDMEYLFTHHLRQLVLQVTQQCNFRCSYCPYTVGDDYVQRGHSANRMDWETAKAAIDFFADRTRDVPSPAISFYGGEPLLEKDLIIRCVEYCKKRFAGKNLIFSMTTNASLLTEELARYFLKSHFKLMISLDGPPEIHDRNRRIASNGEGSFRAVYDTVMSLAEKIPGVLSCIDFNAVVDPQNDISKVNRFFSNQLSQANHIRAGLVDPPPGTTLYFSPEYQQKQKTQELLAMLAVEGYVDPQKLPLIAKNEYEQIKDNINKMSPHMQLPDRMMHGGPCIPGYRKLFVTTTGTLLPCEKCSETSEEMNIGNLNDGFDFENIKKLMNGGNRVEQDCKDCWAIENCDICGVKVDGIHDPRELRRICRSSRLNFEHRLNQIIALREMEEGGLSE